MRKSSLSVALALLVLASACLNKSSMKMNKHEIGRAVSSLLEDLRKSNSISEYINRLHVYETFKKDNKDSGTCFPAAPNLETRPLNQTPTQAHKRCVDGYKLGERHGKKWAKISLRDGRSFAEGMDNLRCLLTEVNPASPDVLPICIFKGAKLSYIRWHQRYSSKQTMDEYTSLSIEQGESSHEDGSRVVPDGTERSMTPEEMEFVKSIGLSDKTKAEIASQK
jgi:hypothetical protein